MDNIFSPIPFWFWNDELDEKEIERQIREMHSKGIDGFVIHPRKGLPKTIEYLGDRYFEFVRFAVELASRLGMIVVLYDEAMYPSGSAHGRVVESNPGFASQGLVQYAAEDGTHEYKMELSEGTIRGVHEEEDDGERYAPKSADLLNPEAVKCFIECTHEKYYAKLKEYFGNTIKAIFTDEPNILGRNSRTDMIPWSDGIMEEYESLGGKRENLHFLFLAKEDKDNGLEDAIITKRIYKKVIHDRMAKSYYKQLSEWCSEHGIGLTGHPEKGTDIGYMKYFAYPCQDIVWRYVEPEEDHAISGPESCMGKCSSDAARHRGIRRNGNECFGCCSKPETPYTFTDKDMRWYLNWLFVRGVNLVYPHAFYYSIRDGRGDERPPEVGMNNPFWPDYKKLSDYIKYMCEAQTDVVNYADIAILCNESEMSWEVAKPLYENQIEFNYLEEELLPACKVEDSCVKLAKQSYKLIIYDNTFDEMMNDDSREHLKQFEAAGVIVIRYSDRSEIVNKIEELGLSTITVCGKNQKDIRCSYLSKGKRDYLIITNEGINTAEITLDVKDRVIESLYDAFEKRSEEVNFAKASIKLNASESRVIYLK